MAILQYFTLTDQQMHQLKRQLELLKADRSRPRKLLELQYSVVELNDFLRPSNSQVVCVNRKAFEGLMDPKLAYRIIESSYGDRVVEFIPPIRKK